MATETNVNKVFASLGARLADAHNAAKDVPVNTGGGIGFPDGVRGVALLTGMEFVEGKKADDKGKFYFMAKAVCMTPAFHDGVKCAGKHFNRLVPMFDTPKRQNKKTFLPDTSGVGHWTDIRDLLASFGVDQPPPQQPGESKEATAQRIGQWLVAAMGILAAQAKDTDHLKRPHFEFHTWKGEKATEGQYKGKEPMVTVFWDGRTEWKPSETAADPASGVTASPSVNGQQPPTASPTAAVTPQPPPPVHASPPAQQPTAAPASAVTDEQLDAWAEAADADPDMVTDEAVEGKNSLSAVCSQVGVTNDEAKMCDDWKAVVVLVKARRNPQTSAPTVGVKAVAKGAGVGYNGQRCEVTSVNAEGRTVTLKVVGGKSVMGADGKLLKVGFDLLS